MVPALLPVPVLAGDSNVFGGIDILGGMARGSSSTTDGGAAVGGGGVVTNVDFGNTVGVGGHVGYRFNPSLSAFLSYQHVSGDISWNANFPAISAASDFEGTASSDAVMANLAYDFPLSDVTTFRTTAGLGVTFNTLSDVTETDLGSGSFLSDVEEHTEISPIAQIGAGVNYEFAPGTKLGLDALVAYSGGFETGNTRRGNLGVTEIKPYQIEDVWRANIGISLNLAF
ncbi:hypothetical protein TH468_16230 [Thalassospira sp. MCCC 1A03138]|nr:hypothetical protein TH468_16230 [Thalassospira sp. MCCC 1A03138]